MIKMLIFSRHYMSDGLDNETALCIMHSATKLYICGT